MAIFMRKAWVTFAEGLDNFFEKKKQKLGRNLMVTYSPSLNLLDVICPSRFISRPAITEILGDARDEQSECFHQGIKLIKECFEGRWDNHKLVDYCCQRLQASERFSPFLIHHLTFFDACMIIDNILILFRLVQCVSL